MRLYGKFTKIEERDDGTLVVAGVASSETKDADDEVVKRDAMMEALPDYFKSGPALREMHQPMAAGKGLHASVDAQGRTQFEALVVDPVAVKKVQTGVYTGFSIGGRVLRRNEEDPRVIEAIRLTEISLVDRPANPDARISLWKAEDSATEEESHMDELTKAQERIALLEGEVKAAQEKVATAEAKVAEMEKLAKAGKRFSKETADALAALHKACKGVGAACAEMDAGFGKLGYIDEEATPPAGNDPTGPAASATGAEGASDPGHGDTSAAGSHGADKVRGHGSGDKAELPSDLVKRLDGLEASAKANADALAKMAADRDALAAKLKDAEEKLLVKGAVKAVDKSGDAGADSAAEALAKAAWEKLSPEERTHALIKAAQSRPIKVM